MNLDQSVLLLHHAFRRSQFWIRSVRIPRSILQDNTSRVFKIDNMRGGRGFGLSFGSDLLAIEELPKMSRRLSPRRWGMSCGNVKLLFPGLLDDQDPDDDPKAQQNGDHAPPEEGPFLLFLHYLLPM
jgi:hypothetical protein